MQNKNIVLITGSSNGLGAGLVKELSGGNYIPIITYKTDEMGAIKVASEIRNDQNIIIQKVDVSIESDLEKLVEEILQKYGHIDTLICNAGIDFKHSSFEEIELSEWIEVYNAKVFGTFNSVKHALPLLRKSDNPNIIVISASLANNPDPLDPVYSSACAAVTNFAQSLVYSLKSDRIRTNIICPGPMDTNLPYWKQLKESNPDIFKNLEETNPLNLTTTAKDVANIVISVVDNRILNGNTLYATGGSHLRT